MIRKLSAHFVTGFIITAAVTALTACGGSTTTQQMPVAEASNLITAPALGAGNEAAESTLAAATTPSQVPVATTPADTIPTDITPTDIAPTDITPTDITPVNTTAESPITDSPATGSALADTGVSDQMLLSGASDVGCDADAAVFNPTMLALVNASRIETRMCGNNLRTPVSTVEWNDKLAVAAAMHGEDMTSNNFFSHTGSDGLGVGERATTATYNWRAVGENIAAGHVDQAEVHQGWLDSEGHCINIMNQLFTEVGAACITDPSSDFGTYWVVVFGDSK